MKRLDRYVVRDMFLPLTAGTVILASLFMLNELIALLKQQVSQVPALAIAQLAMYAMPKWIVYTLPVGLAFGVSISVSRLIRESEMTALRAAGVSVARVIRPVVAFGLAFTVLSFVLVERVQPWAEAKRLKLGQDFMTVAGQRDFLIDVPVMLGRYLVKVRMISRNRDGTLDLQGVFLHEEINPGEHEFVLADRGRYKDGTWTFTGAQVYVVSGDQLLAINSRDLSINQRIELGDFFRMPTLEEKSIVETWTDIQEDKKIGRDSRRNEAALHGKVVMPLTCIVFALSSAYVCVRTARMGAYVGTFLSFVFAWLFFNLHIVALEIVAAHGWLPAAVAMYVPLLTLVVITCFLVWGAE